MKDLMTACRALQHFALLNTVMFSVYFPTISDKNSEIYKGQAIKFLAEHSLRLEGNKSCSLYGISILLSNYKRTNDIHIVKELHNQAEWGTKFRTKIISINCQLIDARFKL